MCTIKGHNLVHTSQGVHKYAAGSLVDSWYFIWTVAINGYNGYSRYKLYISFSIFEARSYINSVGFRGSPYRALWTAFNGHF